MWALINRTPLAAERTWVRDKDGHHLWVVVVKATYDLDDRGALTLADEQPAPLREPKYSGKPGQSSIRFDTDMLEPKPTTDILVNATSHAPGGTPTKTVEVSLRIDGVEKTLLVHGPRVYWQSRRGVAPSAPQPFVNHPIVYEWAYGGTDLSDPDTRKHRMDLRNPVGRGLATRPQTLIHQPAHRIEYPRAEDEPAGFCAIASHWSPRLELAGTYDAAWDKSRRPLLPRDYDARARLCAPADQRPATHLRGGEIIVLGNLTPRGSLAITLPRISLEFMTHVGVGKRAHEAQLGTVIIEPEQRSVALVWHTALAVGPREVDYLDATVISQRAT